MDRFHSMTVFVAVVRDGSFSAAARSLHMPVSSVSRAIARLEDALSTRLLNRTTRSMSTTPAGRRYFDHCVSVLSEMRAFEASLKTQDDMLRGFFRMTAPGVLGQLYLNTIISGFLQDNPLVDVDVRLTGRTIDLVAEGFDLAVRPRPAEDSGIIARHLGQLRLITVASPDYLQRHGHAHDRAALETHRLAVHSQRIPRSVMAAFVGGASSGSRIVSNDINLLRTMAVEGTAITSAPYDLVSEDLRAGRLVQILPDEVAATVDICVIWPRNQHLSAVVRAFVDRLVRDWPSAEASPVSREKTR